MPLDVHKSSRAQTQTLEGISANLERSGELVGELAIRHHPRGNEIVARAQAGLSSTSTTAEGKVTANKWMFIAPN